MKFVLLTCTFLALLPLSLLAQAPDGWQLRTFGGVFSPSNDEIQNIYGDSFTGQLVAAAPIGSQGRLTFGFDYLNRGGDPFFRTPDFDAGDAAQLTLAGLSIGAETFVPVSGFPRLYLGAGLNYVFGQEEITGEESGNGRALGGYLSVTPEFRLSQKVSFMAQASYRFLEMTFKSGRDRYRFNLSGANLLLGLGYTF